MIQHNRGGKSVCGFLTSIVKPLGVGLGLCVTVTVICLPFGLKSHLHDMYMYMSAAST